jgi:predicted ATPase
VRTNGLLERDRELAAIDRVIDEAVAGQGRLLLIEGPAGSAASNQ